MKSSPFSSHLEGRGNTVQQHNFYIYISIMAKKLSANSVDRTPPSSAEERLHESLVRDLGGLYRDRATADLEFIVGPRGERVKAHRLILQFRCEKYKSGWAGEQGTAAVRLERADVRSFKSVLRYVYTGKVRIESRRELLWVQVVGGISYYPYSIYGIRRYMY